MAAVKLVTGAVKQDMPLLALGTWKSKPGQVKEAVKVAVESGYRHIDCAAAYGNEKEVGQALQEVIGTTVQRQDLFITSKLWNTKHRTEDVRPAVLQTLADLQLTYLDLYLMHWPMGFRPGPENMPRLPDGSIAYDTETHFLETWKAMEGLVKEGLVRHIGLSNFNSKQITEVCTHASIQPTVLQCESHPYLSQEPLIAHTKSHNIVFVAYSPLGSPDRPWAKPDEPSLLDDPQITAIAERCGRTTAQVLIRFQLQRGLGAVAKSITAERIRANFQVNDFELSEADMAALRSFNRDWRACLPKATVEGQEVARDRSHPHFPFNIPH